MKPTFVFLIFLFFLSCKQTEKHPYTFYYWKTNLALKPAESSALKKATTPCLYTRFFDVDKIGGKFQPLGVITKEGSFVTDKEIVPVVFIMNRAFVNIKPDEILFLAKRVFSLIEKKQRDFQFRPSTEIQIDCDWTAGTRDDYFKFLNELRKVSKKEITSTLRLHQVKDKKVMGIPPVSKVYLMCYSTSSPLENSNKNSILDVQLAKNYLAQLQDYPIKSIDVALPIYSWGIVTNHFGKRKLINALSGKDLENPDFKKNSENEAEVLKDGFYFGNYLNKGFKIKIEEISTSQLNEVNAFLEKKLTHHNVVYYQLDDNFVTHANL